MPPNRRAQSWDVWVWIRPLTIGWDYRGCARGRRKSARRVNGLLVFWVPDYGVSISQSSQHFLSADLTFYTDLLQGPWPILVQQWQRVQDGHRVSREALLNASHLESASQQNAAPFDWRVPLSRSQRFHQAERVLVQMPAVTQRPSELEGARVLYDPISSYSAHQIFLSPVRRRAAGRKSLQSVSVCVCLRACACLNWD